MTVATRSPRMAHGMRDGEFIALISMASALTALAIDTVLPAFDEIRAAFGLAPDSAAVSWTVTAFFLGMAMGELVHGPLSDRFGRKPILLLGVAIYALGALAATLSGSLAVLIASRVVWGFGASAPRSVGLAVIRDCYSGDRMARVLSLSMAVFLTVPVVAPGLGEVLLRVGGWRWTLGVSVLLAVVVGVWMVRLRETLPPSARRAVAPAELVAAGRYVLSQRAALAYIVAFIFAYAAFVPWLGSSELIFSELYGRGDTFALYLGGVSVVMGLTILASGLLVERLGASSMAVGVSVLMAAIALVGVVVSIGADGLPGFWTFLVLAAGVVALNAAVSPVLNALALEPMGAIAGTASGAIGFSLFSIGALLASLVATQISTSVTPLFVGFCVYSSLGLAAVLAGRRATVSQA